MKHVVEAPAGNAGDDGSLTPWARYVATGAFLFHYTGVEGLLGISNSKSLWASHAFYMNDPMEISHAYELLVNEVAALRKSARTAQERHVLIHLAKWVKPLNDLLPIFVFSLTKPADSLNHWRLYTPKRKGVAIGFPVEVLESAAARAGFRLVRCLYEVQAQREALRAVIKTIVSNADAPAGMIATKENPGTLPYHDFFDSRLPDLTTVMATLKAEPFSEEAEWRLVSLCRGRHLMPNNVRFRPGASLLLPYLEISLEEEMKTHEGSVVLIADPEIDDLAREALFAFATGSKLIRTMITSRAPLRRYQ